MEVIVTNVPFNLDAEGLHGALRRFMDPLGCFAYRCDKLFNRDRTNMHRCGVAKISLPSRELGAQFLRQHGDRAAAFGEFQALTQIRIGGRDLHIAEAMGPQNRPMDRYLMQSLQDTQRQMVIRRARRPRPRKRHELPLQREYPLLSFAVGAWNHDADGLVFVKHLLERRSCKVTFGRSDIRIRQFQGTGLPQFHLLVMPYAIVESITRDLSGPASITISLSEPPRVYVNDALMIGGQSVPQAGSESRNFKRVNGMDDLHAAIVSTCLVHRCFLEHGGDMEKVRSIEQIRALPRLIDIPSRLAEPSLGESLGITPLQQDISNYNLPFAIAFQIQKLTQYGHLQPHQLSKLIPTIASQVERKGAIYAEHALRDLNHTLPRAGPSMLEDDGYSQLSIEGIKAKLREAEYSGMDRYYAQSQLQDLHEQLCMIYKAVVTPTAVLLYGPELETKNRVLRIYEPYIEHFLRVQFRDESGEQMRGDAYVSLDEVYEQRFKGVLRDGITIADRHFEFLGFSHSSLRNQSCWFMAPFRLSDGQLMTARGVISELGDFSEMRIPAKCAARIGQAFSETIMSIDLDPRCLNKENDVEKKGRLFSDGVGTISTALWERIIAQRPEWQRLRPTVFQIRYAGRCRCQW